MDKFEAFDCLAGSSLGTWSDSEVCEELIDVLNFQCGADAKQVALDLIDSLDADLEEHGHSSLDDMDSQYLYDLADELIGLLNDYADIPASTAICWQDNEVSVIPFIDDCFPKYSDHPDRPGNDHEGQCAEYEYYRVNDHGNVDYMVWNTKQQSYINVWSMV